MVPLLCVRIPYVTGTYRKTSNICTQCRRNHYCIQYASLFLLVFRPIRHLERQVEANASTSRFSGGPWFGVKLSQQFLSNRYFTFITPTGNLRISEAAKCESFILNWLVCYHLVSIKFYQSRNINLVVFSKSFVYQWNLLSHCQRLEFIRRHIHTNTYKIQTRHRHTPTIPLYPLFLAMYRTSHSTS